jgi:hypothetical protein
MPAHPFGVDAGAAMDPGESGIRQGKGEGTGNGKCIVCESRDVVGHMETVRKKWAEFTTALRFAPGPCRGRSRMWLSSARPETEGEAERIVFTELSPEVTRVTVAVRYDEDDLLQEGETFTDVARRLSQDMALFKDYVEGDLPKDWPASIAS